jgi:hypothetical protein
MYPKLDWSSIKEFSFILIIFATIIYIINFLFGLL